MCRCKYWRKLFHFQGYVVSDINVNEELAVVRLRRDERFGLSCPACHAAMGENRRVLQSARDLPLGPATLVLIHYEAIQGWCSACGAYTTFHPPGIDHRAQATDRLKRFVSRLCRFIPLSRITDFVGISGATAFRWDQAVLEQTLPEPDLDNLSVLLVDEKAVRKHYGFVTLVMNGETGELLHLAEGKKKTSFESFFDRLTPEQKARIKAVAMDRNGAYYRVVRKTLPHARIIYDKFHIVANMHKVIDRVRNQEYRNANAQDKDVIKGQRFNLYRNPENCIGKQRRELKNLLKLNANINKVYVLKEALKQLWTYQYAACARKYLYRWVAWAKDARIDVLTRFAEGLLRDQEELVDYCRYPITIGRLEGFNNTVSRLVHRACGIRNLHYLFLKLRQESIPHALQT